MHVFLTFLVQLFGFYILYSTSARAVFVRRRFHRWVQEHVLVSRFTGWALLTASLVAFIAEFGILVGVLVFLTCLMTVSGFIIILHPLQRTLR